MECICVVSMVTTGLTVANKKKKKKNATNCVNGVECIVTGQNLFLSEIWGISLSIFRLRNGSGSDTSQSFFSYVLFLVLYVKGFTIDKQL